MAKNMAGFTYRVSLRAFHPDMKLDDVLEPLGIKPKVCWSKGEQKVTPKNTKLDGLRNSSYWCADLSGESPISSETVPLDKFLITVCCDLIEHKSIFEFIRYSGGETELFVGYYSDPNSGFVLPKGLLLSLADLSLDIGFDIYP